MYKTNKVTFTILNRKDTVTIGKNDCHKTAILLVIARAVTFSINQLKLFFSKLTG